MNFCKDCKWYKLDRSAFHQGPRGAHFCSRDFIEEFDLVTGEVSGRYGEFKSCYPERANEDKCGKEGKFFSSK